MGTALTNAHYEELRKSILSGDLAAHALNALRLTRLGPDAADRAALAWSEIAAKLDDCQQWAAAGYAYLRAASCWREHALFLALPPRKRRAIVERSG